MARNRSRSGWRCSEVQRENPCRKIRHTVRALEYGCTSAFPTITYFARLSRYFRYHMHLEKVQYFQMYCAKTGMTKCVASKEHLKPYVNYDYLDVSHERHKVWRDVIAFSCDTRP
jgi:hypothetical protein